MSRIQTPFEDRWKNVTVQLHAQDHADRIALRGIARPRSAPAGPENRGHAALFRDDLGEAARSGLGEKKDRIVEVALARPVCPCQHVDLAERQTNVPHGTIAVDVNLAD